MRVRWPIHLSFPIDLDGEFFSATALCSRFLTALSPRPWTFVHFSGRAELLQVPPKMFSATAGQRALSACGP